MEGVGPEDVAEFAGGVDLAPVVGFLRRGGRVSKVFGGGVQRVWDHGFLGRVVGSGGGEDDGGGGREVGSEEIEEETMAEMVRSEGSFMLFGRSELKTSGNLEAGVQEQDSYRGVVGGGVVGDEGADAFGGGEVEGVEGGVFGVGGFVDG